MYKEKKIHKIGKYGGTIAKCGRVTDNIVALLEKATTNGKAIYEQLYNSGGFDTHAYHLVDTKHYNQAFALLDACPTGCICRSYHERTGKHIEECPEYKPNCQSQEPKGICTKEGSCFEGYANCNDCPDYKPESQAPEKVEFVKRFRRFVNNDPINFGALWKQRSLKACKLLEAETKEVRRLNAMWATENILRNDETSRADAAEDGMQKSLEACVLANIEVKQLQAEIATLKKAKQCVYDRYEEQLREHKTPRHQKYGCIFCHIEQALKGE